MARVFVSHSSHDKAYAQQFVAALDGPPIEPLIDFEDLQAGRWNPQLNEWMSECHAAVLLLSTEALKSPWVLKEATMLVWRASTEEDFVLVPMLVGHLKRAQVRRSRRFAPLYLGDFLMFDGGDPTAAAARARTKLDALEAKLERYETPLERLCRILGERLQGATPAGLREVARKLTLSEPPWQPSEDHTARFAELIARRFVRGELGQFKGLDEVLDVLVNSAQLRSDNAVEVVRLLGPMWVDADAAGRLPALARQSPRGAAAINGDLVKDFTAQMYLQRAYPLSDLWECVHVCGGSEPWSHVDQYAEGVRSGIRELVSADGWTSAQTDKYIASMSNPCFVILPPPHPDGGTLKRLRGMFPRLTFVLNTGSRLPRRPPPPAPPLLPEVDVDREWKAFADVGKATKIAERR